MSTDEYTSEQPEEQPADESWAAEQIPLVAYLGIVFYVCVPSQVW